MSHRLRKPLRVKWTTTRLLSDLGAVARCICRTKRGLEAKLRLQDQVEAGRVFPSWNTTPFGLKATLSVLLFSVCHLYDIATIP